MRWLCVLLIIGCGDSGGGASDGAVPDAAPDAAVDAPAPDAAVDAPAPDAPIEDASTLDGNGPPLVVPTDAGGQMPADYSCNGSRVDPPGASAEFAVSGTVVDFQSANAVPSAVVTSSIDGTTVYDSKTANTLGQFTGLRIPANHYRVWFKTSAQPDYIDTYEIGIPVPPGTTTMTRYSVSHFTATALPGLVGILYDNTQTLVVARVRDCQGRTVMGAFGSITGAADSQIFYFSDQDLPVRRTLQMFTNLDGLFLGVNVAPNAAATISATGAPSGGATELIGQIQTSLVGGTMVMAELPPLGP